MMSKMKTKIHLNNLLPLAEAEEVLENAPAYRIDIRMNEDAFYFWQIRNRDYEVTVKSPPYESRQECLDRLVHYIIKENYFGIPIFDENGQPLDPDTLF